MNRRIMQKIQKAIMRTETRRLTGTARIIMSQMSIMRMNTMAMNIMTKIPLTLLMAALTILMKMISHRLEPVRQRSKAASLSL